MVAEEQSAMLKSRRSLIKTATGVAGVIVFGSGFGVQGMPMEALAQSPQPMPSPNAPANQNVPAGMDGPDIMKPNKSAVNPLNQEHIAAEVQQLYKLAGELKDQVDHTDLKAMFPLDFVKKAQQIEKLAKQIKDQAKG
jgi:hypothetical protein